MHLKKLAVIPAIAALVTIAACGGGDDSSSDTVEQQTEEGGDVGAAQDPDVMGPALPVDGAEEGGTLTVLTSVAPTTLDPTRAYYTDSVKILSLISRGLTGYQRQEDGTYTLVPDMATDLGRVSDDGLEWEWTLKDDVFYQDGSPVLAEDVAYAIKRAFAQDVLTAGPTYHNEYFLDGDTYGGPYKDGDDYAGVEVVDERTFIIKLAKPFNDLPYYAAFPMFTGIPEEADSRLDYEREIVATGPYMIEEYVPQRSLTLVPNPEWVPESDPIRNQFVDGWDFQWSQDSNQLQERIIADNGDDQTALTYDDILAANYRQLLNEEGGEDRLVTGTSPCTIFQAIDTRTITDVNVRKAIGLAYPTDAANQAAGLIPGLTALPTTTILPPGIPGQQDFDVLGTGGEGNGDPAAAKAMLEEAGELGYELSFFFTTDIPESVQASEVIETALEEAGFKVERVPTTSEEIRADLDNPDAPVNLRGSGWCSDWPSGASWFPAILDGSLVNPDSVPNLAFLDEPEVNQEIDRILALEDAEEAATAWGELDELIMDKYYPYVLRYVSGVATFHGSRVGNMENDSTFGLPDFQVMYVVPE